MKENSSSVTQTIDPPGFEIEKFKKCKPRGLITFPDNRSKALMSPLVEAAYINETLSITTVIFVPPFEDKKALDLKIYQNWYSNIEGVPQLQFFICYDMSESVSKDFLVYEVTFDAESKPFEEQLSMVKTIQTFLWDVDPIASRGTITNVQTQD
jgi:hypothetical protein